MAPFNVVGFGFGRDIIVADRTGIVVIPQEKAQDILRRQGRLKRQRGTSLRN
jgi:regulator of RNase E activity RraA